MEDIISKLKTANLIGRGGAGFPTWQKWEGVLNAKGNVKYVVCNASEGEPLVFKDKYILENYLEDVINGIGIAAQTIDAKECYVYLNKNYFKTLGKEIEKAGKKLKLKVFKKPEGYISGEETTILNNIEGKLKEPRLKPPFPTEAGLFGCPTLINNVETFYHISKIDKGEYKGTKFFCITGDIKKKGVYELPENYTVKQALEATNNMPDFDFFVQSGGGAAGEILLKNELDRPVFGMASIVVFDKEKTDTFSLMKKWADFFISGNCDKCTPCREGVYRIKEILKNSQNGKVNKDILKDLCLVLDETSFCPLGRSVSRPFKSLIDKIL